MYVIFLRYTSDMSNRDLIFLNYLSRVFENLDDAIMLCMVRSERDLEVLLVNQGFYKITGYKKGNVEQIGDELAAQPTNRSFMEQCYQVVQDKEITRAESIIAVPSGTKRVCVKIVPVINSLGEVTHIVLIGRDITDGLIKDQRIADLEAELAKLKKK